jgi:type II secretory pathway pseudopilin PulG
MDNHALRALTAAALALPGIAAAPANAQDNAAVLQFGRYQETSRDLFGLSSKYEPLRSDSLQASAWSAFTDRLSATFNFHQDTWSGATPIATAPREWRGNRSRAVDAVSGASPYVVMTGPLYLDKATHKPLRTDGFGNLAGGEDTQLVHTIAGASRETRGRRT